MTVTSVAPETRRLPKGRWRSLPGIKGLFDSPTNIAITLAYCAAFAWLVVPLIRWAIFDATFTGDAVGCAGHGACWAFIGEKWHFILFGTYPVDRSWRPASACMLLVGLLIVACVPRLWGRALVYAGVTVLITAVLLLSGLPNGPAVSTEQWGGLPVTLLLSVASFVGAFPLAVLLALWRRSSRGGVRLLSIAFIEIVRGVPLISLLYMATLLFPLMLPGSASIDKLIRAEVALTLFVAAYLAEIVRAGLQAVPRGQYEAALSLGLSHRQAIRHVVLPQALRAVIPPMVNLATGIFQDTTLVVIIGMFDLLNTARAAASDPNWLGFYNEAFAFVAVIYFGFCFSLSRYSLWLERHFGLPKQ